MRRDLSSLVEFLIGRQHQVALGNHALVRLPCALDTVLRNFPFKRSKADDLIVPVCGESGNRRDEIDGLPDLELVGKSRHGDIPSAA